MCGFVGKLLKDKIADVDIKEVKRMTEVMGHRGPDKTKIYSDNNICLGFNRLSIVSLDDGDQPFLYKDDNYILVFNGEIYNYEEIKEELKEHEITFQTNTEAETILAAYIQYGKEFVKKLRGMFAFVIWDKITREIICGRDYFGIKPFYYYENRNGFYFASEMKSIYETMNFDMSLNDESIHNYLTFQYVPEPNTIFKKVNILEPGYLLIRDIFGNIQKNKYWEPTFKNINISKDSKLKKVREAIEESVEYHMKSDVPVASFLSGGVDSTIVTALASKIKPSLETYTVGFDINGYSEIEKAKRTSEYLGVNNIHKFVTVEEFARAVPKVVWYLDSPVADPSTIPIYFICKEAAKKYKVILSGEGSDELFGGYTIYHEPLSLKGFKIIPDVIKRGMKEIAELLPENIKGRSFFMRGCTDIESRYVGNAKIFTDEEKVRYLLNHEKNYRYVDVTKSIYENAQKYDDVTKMQYVDINTWLRGDILVKSDRLSMANSLELRVPFLDKEVFKVASELGLKDKLKGKETKVLLREAFKDIIPKDAAERTKLGYPVPIRVWLKDELYDWAQNIIENSGTDEIINIKNTLNLLEEHRKGIKDNSRKIWTVLTFNLWYDQYINRKEKELKDLERKKPKGGFLRAQ